MKKRIVLAGTLFLFGSVLPVMAGDWQDDQLFGQGEPSVPDGNWQVGVSANLASRGFSEIGGFVSDDVDLGENIYLWHRPSGLYIQAQNSNSLNGEMDFGDGQAYSIGLYHEVFVNDMFVDVGYKYDDLWDVDHDLNTDFHSVYLGVYLPRIGATGWCDGLRFYAEGQGTWPDDEDTMTMGGGFMARVGVKTNFFVFTNIMPEGLEVDLSGGGNDGIYGREPDIFGFGMLKLLTRYSDIGGSGITVEPYVAGITQSRPGDEENETIGIAGLSLRFDSTF